MTVQEALVIAGNLSLVVAVLLMVLAARCYVVDDIRGVRDDLSGRRRMRGMREAGRMHKRPKDAPVLASVDESIELATQVVQQEGDETEVVLEGRASVSSFVVTRDVVVCDGGRQ